MRLHLLVAVVLIAFGAFVGTSLATEGPMADAGLDQSVANGTTVQLDGSGSIHPDGRIDSYEWSVDGGDETLTPECTNCERTEFDPPAPGRYEVTLGVTGDDGKTASDTLYLNVTDAGPEVDIVGPRTATTEESITLRAEAESPDSTLDRVDWAVDDRIIDERPLDGSADRGEIRLAFPDADTYRIQAVAFDANGRSAYAERYVRVDRRGDPEPGEGSGSVLIPDRIPDPDSPSERLSDVRITYETDGFYRTSNAGSMSSDSAYVGTETTEVGVDGGENAPWNRSPIDGLWEMTDSAGESVFGHEREVIECELTGVLDGCRRAARQAERDGRTESVRSPDDSGTFHRYGLKGIERIDGPDPGSIGTEQTATVVFIVQREADGAVDVLSDASGRIADDTSNVADIAGSVTSSLLSRSADGDSFGGSTDDTGQLEERNSIFQRDGAGESTSSRGSRSGSGVDGSYTGSESSTIKGSSNRRGSSTDRDSGSESGGSSSSSSSSGGSSSSTDTSISDSASSIYRSVSTGGNVMPRRMGP